MSNVDTDLYETDAAYIEAWERWAAMRRWTLRVGSEREHQEYFELLNNPDVSKYEVAGGSLFGISVHPVELGL